MSYNKIPADRYYAAKARHEKFQQEYGGEYPFDAIPVDLYGGFVPLDKDAEDNMEKTVRCNEERFGHETQGV